MVVGQIPQDASAWWSNAIASPLALQLLGIFIVLAIAAAVCLKLLWRYRIPIAERSGQGGTAMLEFALVMPFFLLICLLLTQTALMYGGTLIVHYSAYAATRSAIVYIPQDFDNQGEPPNVYYDGGVKHQRIRQAAIVAVMPVAGRMSVDTAGVQADEVVSGLQHYFARMGGNQPAWIDRLIADRVRYAADEQNTRVNVSRAVVRNGIVSIEPPVNDEFSTRDAINVRVTHRLNLSTPWVRGLFADGSQPVVGGTGKYAEVVAHYTLTNEGIPDRMPDLPDLERIEPQN